MGVIGVHGPGSNSSYRGTRWMYWSVQYIARVSQCHIHLVTNNFRCIYTYNTNITHYFHTLSIQNIVTDMYIHNIFMNIQLYKIHIHIDLYTCYRYIYCQRYTYKIHVSKFTYFALKEKIQYGKQPLNIGLKSKYHKKWHKMGCFCFSDYALIYSITFFTCMPIYNCY